MLSNEIKVLLKSKNNLPANNPLNKMEVGDYLTVIALHYIPITKRYESLYYEFKEFPPIKIRNILTIQAFDASSFETISNENYDELNSFINQLNLKNGW